MKKLMLLGIILSLGVTTYSEGLQLNLGYDAWRSISDAPNDGGSQTMNNGFTVGGEYILDYNDDFHYGVGGEFRSRFENSDYTLNVSAPVYMVGKYDIWNDNLYLVGRVGYNVTSNVIGRSTGGGHYVAAGIGKNIGLFDIEVLYENMGYTFKDTDTSGTQSSVGIKFGIKLGDMYDAFKGNSTTEEDQPVVTGAEASEEDQPVVTGAEASEETTPVATEVEASEETTPAVTGATTATVVATESSSSEATTTYKVEEGDNLYRIGLKYNMTWDKLSEANDLSNPDLIITGEELEIPSK